MKPWQAQSFKLLLGLALAEDLDSGDATSLALRSDNSESDADIIAKKPCVIAGQWVASAVFREVDNSLEYSILVPDSDEALSGQVIATIKGKTSSILAGERVALNFLQRMSGIATATRNLVTHVKGNSCKIVDTRKTVPGHRQLDKYAVRMGGGFNHRMNLSDGILIKDNHIAAKGGITHAVQDARQNGCHTLKIQIEVTNFSQATEAVEAGADSLLLDNMTPENIKKIVDRFGSSTLLECSGNITIDTIDEFARTGIHIISVGALTHSVIAADISLNLR